MAVLAKVVGQVNGYFLSELKNLALECAPTRLLYLIGKRIGTATLTNKGLI